MSATGSVHNTPNSARSPASTPPISPRVTEINIQPQHAQASPPPSPVSTPRGDQPIRNGTDRIEMQLVPTIEAKPVHGVARLTQEIHPLTYLHTSTVAFGGKRYRLTLEIPVGKQPRGDEKIALEKAIAEFREKFLESLRNNVARNIRPGTDFSVIFHDEGYTAFVPDDAYTKGSDPVGDAEKTAVHQKVTDKVAKELSDIIQSDNDGTGKEILKLLKKSEVLKKETAPAEDAPPSISHETNSCYAATATWYLIDNPLIKKYLPEAIQKAQGKDLKLLETFKALLDGGKSLDIKPLVDALHEHSPTDFPKDTMCDASNLVSFLQNRILPKDQKEILPSVIYNEIPTTSSAEQIDIVGDGKWEAPANLVIGGNTYRLTKAMKHIGKKEETENGTSAESGHWIAMTRNEKGNFYLCNDMKGNQKLKDEQEFLNETKGAVRFLYVKEARAIEEAKKEKAAEPTKPVERPPVVAAPKAKKEPEIEETDSKVFPAPEISQEIKLNGIRGGTFTLGFAMNKKCSESAPLMNLEQFKAEIKKNLSEKRGEYTFDFRRGKGGPAGSFNYDWDSLDLIPNRFQVFLDILASHKFSQKTDVKVILPARDHHIKDAETLVKQAIESANYNSSSLAQKGLYALKSAWNRLAELQG
jgi:hypothetical protein